MKKNYLIMVCAGMLALSFAGCSSVELAAKSSQLPDNTNTETAVADGGYLVEAIPAREREETPVKGGQNRKPNVVIKAVGPEEVAQPEDEDAEETTDEIEAESVEEDIDLNETNDSLIVYANHIEYGCCKGADVWEDDWTIPANADVEWYFYSDTSTGCQYITTRITDYALWIIPHYGDEYVLELPGGTYADGELTNDQIVVLLKILREWSSYPDMERVDSFSSITLECGDSYRKLTFKSDDYTFIHRNR